MANAAWLTLGLGALPVAVGAVFVLLAGLVVPLYPASLHAARHMALIATPFSVHSEFERARGLRRPQGCYWATVEGLAWLVVGLPCVFLHMVSAVLLAASVAGLPAAALHLRLAALSLTFRWVLPAG